MASNVSSDNTSDAEVERRACPSCNIRMSSLVYDKHNLCVKCRGLECDHDNKCPDCIEWPKDVFERYIKHQKSLKSKAKKPKSDKAGSSSKSLEGGNPVGRDVGVASGAGVSESFVRDLIKDSLAVFSTTLSSSMAESFCNMEELISNQVASVRQDFNSFFSGPPPHSPVQPSPSQGQPDPSLGRPDSDYGKSGAKRGETEGEGMTDFPDLPGEICKELRAAGVSSDAVGSIRVILAKEKSLNRDQSMTSVGSGVVTTPRGPLFGSSGGQQGVQGSAAGASDPSEFRNRIRKLANAPVNYGASTSRDVPVRTLGGVDDVIADDDVSVKGDEEGGDKFKASLPEGLRRLFQLIGTLCPESVPPPEPSPSRTCKFEGMFSGVVNSPKEDFSPVLFHRVAEILDLYAKKFRESAEAGKFPSSSLPPRRRVYSASGSPELSKPSILNPSLPRLVGSVSTNKSAGFTLFEAAKLEGVAKHAIETQSVAFWAFNSIMQWLKEEGFTPVEPFIFDELIQSFSLSMVNSTSALASLATFLKAKRREAILSHFPANVGKHFRTQLQASSFKGELLFDESVLQRVLSESREDSAVSANVALSKVISLPVFGGAKSGSKASTDQASASSASTSNVSTPPIFTYKGKGKGSKGQKRKGGGNQSGSARGGKAARGGNASKGQNFAQ